MKKTEFTKGKWTPFDNESDDITIQSDNGEMIGCIWQAPDEISMRANAKLIAKSPVMHRFLTELIDGLKDKSELSIWEHSLLNGAKKIIEATE